MNEDQPVERRCAKYDMFKYVLLGIYNNRPYYMGEHIEEHLKGFVPPVPPYLTKLVLDATQSGAKYQHYVILATRVDRAEVTTWLFHAEIVVPTPMVEWST